MVSIGVTTLSGGLDSTTVSAYARLQVDRLTALTFSYGQAHSRELNSAREVSRALGIQHQVVDISAYAKVAWYSSLTNPGKVTLPIGRDLQEMTSFIPNSYVPLRNTFFVTIAGAYLESQALCAIEEDHVPPNTVRAKLFMAPNAIDYSGYPDCRPEFYDKMGEVLRLGSKLWGQYHVPIEIETPIIAMSKAEIVRWAMELKAPLELTWSCYRPGPEPCRVCDACQLRARGFEETGVEDPALVRLRGGA